MDFKLIFFGSLVSVVLVLVAVYLFAAIVPYVFFLRVGLKHFVFGDKSVNVVLGDYKHDLDQALLERDKARKNLSPLAEGSVSAEYVHDLSKKFSSAETVVKKARQRFDRAIGVAFVCGHGHDATRYLK